MYNTQLGPKIYNKSPLWSRTMSNPSSSSSSSLELKVSSPSILLPPALMNRLPTSPTEMRLRLDSREGDVMQICGGGGMAGKL